MTAFLELVGGLRAAIFLALAVVLGIGAGVQSWRLDTRTEQRDALQEQVTLYASANENNVRAIADLKAANKAWADAARDTQHKAAQAVETVARERDALAAELAQRRNDRGVIYRENPDAAAWARMPVPAGIADSLRE